MMEHKKLQHCATSSAVSKPTAPPHRTTKLDGAKPLSVLEGQDVGPQVGLGAALAKMMTKMDWEASRQTDDARSMAALRTRLDELIAGSIAKPLTRPNAIDLLTAFSESLGPTLAEERAGAASHTVLYLQHPAIGLLNQLIDALGDLDNGKVDEALKHSTHQANAALSIRQRKEDKLLLDSVAIIQQAGGLKTRHEAEGSLARKLNKAGKTRRDKRFTGPMLKKLRDHSKNRK
jgi:hypothetical protein